jgi:DNA-binding PadR family transcriptional regulator
MTPLTNAEVALLGLLTEQSMHPYSIEQEVKYRDMRFWTDLSMSSIYKLLRKLETDGLITRKNQVSAENRLQKVYSINKKGVKALQQKIEELLSAPEHIRWTIDVAIYNSDLLPAKTVRTALNAYRDELRKKITGYNDLLGFLIQSGCPAHRFHLAKRPVFLLEAEIQWVDTYLEEMKAKA